MSKGKLLDHFCVFCSGVILLLVIAQIVMRYVFNSPLVWSEELAVFFMVWMTFIGSVIAMRDKEHIEVNIVLEYLPPKARHAMTQFSRMITALFLLVILYYGFQLTLENYNIPSAANQIPMGMVYIIIPLSAAGMLYYNIKNIMKGE